MIIQAKSNIVVILRLVVNNKYSGSFPDLLDSPITQ